MILAVFLLFLFSCSEPQRVEKSNESVDVKELFKRRGCTNCHDLSRPLVGPSFLDIAKRYSSADKEGLLKSLLEGSCGRWKARMECMPPQRLEREEAERMVEWILHLKTKKLSLPSSKVIDRRTISKVMETYKNLGGMSLGLAFLITCTQRVKSISMVKAM
jgi:cytochrome c